MKIKFTKMHGLGNDFVVINGVEQSVHLAPAQIQYMAKRHTGIGFDQLLLVQSSKNAETDFIYRIFNADGSEVAQCGNGARCIAKFLHDEKLTDKKIIKVKTLTGILNLHLHENDLIKVDMGIPTFAPAEIPFIAGRPTHTYPIQVADHLLKVFPLGLGNPHCVLLVPSTAQTHVAELGALITKNAHFPEEANVEFMQVVDRQKIKLRVYERGVGETQACGSGACAAVVAGRMLGLLDEQVSVEQLGGVLHVAWEGENKSVYLTGPAVTVYKGEITL